MKQKKDIKGSLLKDVKKVEKTGDILIDLGVVGTKFSKEAPTSCSKCDSDDFFGLEILGAGLGPIFWVCNNCDKKVMKYSQKTTLKYLNEASELYSCPKDWDNFPYQEEN